MTFRLNLSPSVGMCLWSVTFSSPSCVLPFSSSEARRLEDSGKAVPLRAGLCYGECLLYFTGLLCLYPSQSPESFSDLHHDNLVELLRVTTKKSTGPLRLPPTGACSCPAHPQLNNCSEFLVPLQQFLEMTS